MPIELTTDPIRVWLDVPRTAAGPNGTEYEVIEADDIRMELEPPSEYEISQLLRRAERIARVERSIELSSIASETGVTEEEAERMLDQKAGKDDEDGPDTSSIAAGVHLGLAIFERSVKGWSGFNGPDGAPAPCTPAFRRALGRSEMGLVRWVTEQVQRIAARESKAVSEEVAAELGFRKTGGGAPNGVPELAHGVPSVPSSTP